MVVAVTTKDINRACMVGGMAISEVASFAALGSHWQFKNPSMNALILLFVCLFVGFVRPCVAVEWENHCNAPVATVQPPLIRSSPSLPAAA